MEKGNLQAITAITASLMLLARGGVAGAITPDNGSHAITSGSTFSSSGQASYDWGYDELHRMNAVGWNVHHGSGDVTYVETYRADVIWVGHTECAAYVWWSPPDCDLISTQINQYYLYTHSVLDWKSTGCHEMGHTIDLPHRSGSGSTSSCMWYDSTYFPTKFDSVDIDNAAVSCWFNCP